VPFRVYYAAVVAGAVWIALSRFPGVEPDSWSALAWWAAFVVVADLSAIQLHGGRAYIAVSSSLDYAAIALFGPAAAAMIAVTAAMTTQLAMQRRPPMRVLFNISAFIITITAAGWSFEAFGGTGSRNLGEMLVPLAVCGITYFIVNTATVSVIIALWKGENPWRVWQSTYAWTITHIAAFVPLGAIVVVVYDGVGVGGVALFLTPLILARYVFKLYTDMRREHVDTIRALTSAIDASDPFTKGHSERVAYYSVAIARELGLREDRVTTIELASLVHDIGKIGIAKDILMKPGKLTNDEWSAMRFHPEKGARIVSGLKFLRAAVDVVVHHHERYDGLGYPHGLSGDAIPLESRIVNVADAFDAMMSDRPYRTSLGLAVSMDELRKGCGTQFDPTVVDAFASLIDQERVEVMHSEERLTEEDTNHVELASEVQISAG
jgi:HD-GYP domain-containing protein (c-di-GMP phosphodiesterase class II)